MAAELGVVLELGLGLERLLASDSSVRVFLDWAISVGSLG